MSYCLYTPNRSNKMIFFFFFSKRNYLHLIIKTHERKCWVASGERFVLLGLVSYKEQCEDLPGFLRILRPKLTLRI